MPLLFFFIILLPVIEITLLIKVGQQVGVLYTLVLLLLMGVIGSLLLRQQGFSTLLKVNERLQKGDLPAREIVGGMVIALGALLLLVPGFFTDILAFFCLLPPTRYLLVKYLLKRGLFMMAANPADGFYTRSPHSADDVIEGQFSREEVRRLDKK